MENKYQDKSVDSIHSLLGISIEGETRDKFQTIITWSKITSIGGFVNMGLNLISTIISFKYSLFRFGFAWLMVFSLISLAINFFLNFFLWQFSKNLKNSLDNEDQPSFVMAAMQLKSYMRMLGILLLVSILIGILSYVFVLSSIGHF